MPVHLNGFFYVLKGGEKMSLTVKNYEELPLTMTVDEMAKILGIDRKVAYRIAKEEGLAIRVGEKRLVVPKSKLISYLNK